MASARLAAVFTLGIVWLDQGKPTLARQHPIHLDQKQFLAGLLARAGLLGIGEGRLLERKTRQVVSGYFAKISKSSSEFP